MRPAPVPNIDETHDQLDNAVADPLESATEALWNDTARKNREIFTELFRPVPTNLIRKWDQYDVCLYPPYDDPSTVLTGIGSCRTTCRRLRHAMSCLISRSTASRIASTRSAVRLSNAP